MAAVAVAVAVTACTDVRDYEGDWFGLRVGDGSAVQVGVQPAATAHLSIASIDEFGLSGTLSVDSLITSSSVATIAGAEADALAGTTFTGSPVRVYFTTSNVDDGSGQAIVLVALYTSRRVEVRPPRRTRRSGSPSTPAAVVEPPSCGSASSLPCSVTSRRKPRGPMSSSTMPATTMRRSCARAPATTSC